MLSRNAGAPVLPACAAIPGNEKPPVHRRSFEPFFTTKEQGKGTGLGLAMVYGFARRVGGMVTADSLPGAGTSMRLELPVASATDVGVEPATAAEPASPVRGEAQGTVLLAEDREDIRKVAQGVLQRMGYRVLPAADGAAAMAILRSERGHVDLVVSDVVMPHGGGMLFRNTMDWPDRPLFLLTSGHTAGDLNGDGNLLDTVPFLPKPWSAMDLEAAVARVMRHSSA